MSADSVAERLAEIRERVERAAALRRATRRRCGCSPFRKRSPPPRCAKRTRPDSGISAKITCRSSRARPKSSPCSATFASISSGTFSETRRSRSCASLRRFTRSTPRSSRSELDRRLDGIDIPVERRAFGDEARFPVLVEVNIAGEAQKSGCAPAAARRRARRRGRRGALARRRAHVRAAAHGRSGRARDRTSTRSRAFATNTGAWRACRSSAWA